LTVTSADGAPRADPYAHATRAVGPGRRQGLYLGSRPPTRPIRRLGGRRRTRDTRNRRRPRAIERLKE
jgi:hypothetical protein